MTEKLFVLAQWVTTSNEKFLGVEGFLFGLVLFGGVFVYIEHRGRKGALL